jgi:hypothetical protein
MLNGHPKQRLLFFVAQDVDGEIRNLVRQLIQQISRGRDWLIGPPEFVDSTHDSGSTEEDIPDETVGGLHEIYSALPPNDLPLDIDSLHLAEVDYIVEMVRQFSLDHDIEFEFELDGKHVGTIESGEADALLSKGLLGEWRAHIDSQRG